jgi:hypothetical protein
LLRLFFYEFVGAHVDHMTIGWFSKKNDYLFCQERMNEW